jgi:hypothetical protein
MDTITIDRIKHAANTDAIRKVLIQYFMTKGFDQSFDRMMYPSIMQDLPMFVPMLEQKIEVVPHAMTVDPAAGKATMGWNLFVLGTHRMYLGESYHDNLIDLARQINNGMIEVPERGFGASKRQTTPKKIIAFITRVLGGHKDGYVDLTQMASGVTNQPHRVSNNMANQFFTKSGYGT